MTELGEIMNWSGKQVFDYTEYYASVGEQKFCIAGKGHEWDLTIWTDNQVTTYQRGSSLTSLKIVAENLA